MKKFTFLIAFNILTVVLLVSNIYATKHIVKVSNNKFTPSSFNVTVNDTIRWEWDTNNGSTPHTTTGVAQSIPAGAPTWNSQITQAVSSFEYKVTVAGPYGYGCVYHAGSGMTGTFTATAAPTGIQQQSSILATNLIAYPRPAKETVNISFNSNISENGFIKIYDIQGKEVLRDEIEITVGANLAPINVSDLNKGLYFVEVYANKKRLGIQKVIKD